MKDLLDRRLERATGNYTTREQLVDAINGLRKRGMTHQSIAESVGVTQSTVTRVINGDTGTYVPVHREVDELPSRKLDRLWKPTDVPVEPEEEDDAEVNS